MRYLKLKILLILPFILSINCNLSAQTSTGGNINPQNVNVSKMTDQQVITIAKEIEKRGLSDSEAIALARARGMSQTQIDELMKRLQEIRMNKQFTGEEGDETIAGPDNSYNEELSIKTQIDTTNTKVDTRIFGFNFFNNNKLTFEPNVKISVSKTYIIGSGDEILIDVWGMSQKSYALTVDRNGNIQIPDIGPVNVGNLTLEAATSKIKNKLSSIYSELNASMPRTFANIYIGELKAIKVNVVGEVFAPGTYTLPGTASAFSALYLAGGPNINGSFRDIQVMRDGKVIEHLDVYDFLINGNGMVNIPLRDNDVIMVPTYLYRVKVGGEFKRKGIFEGKEGEKINDLVRFAGGFTENAYSERIELYRNTSKQKQFKNVTKDDLVNISLQSGDSIYAGEILQRFDNKVSIEGAVFRPGNYELTEGLTLSQLIAQADGLREDAFMNRGLITRLNKDFTLSTQAFKVVDIINNISDIKLQKEDIINIASINDLRELQTIKISGEVQKPGEFDYREKMTLSDVVFMAGGLLESASESSIEISRRLTYEETSQFGEKIAHIFQFSITRDLALNGKDASFEIKPFDQIYIRRSPSFSEWGIIKLSGEVKYAGEYGITAKNERVSDLIKRAGGLSPDASPIAAMLTRKVEVTQKVKRLREELALKDSSLKFSTLDFEVVGVNLKEILDNPGGRDDIFLQGGDELTIPREVQTVKISGEVLNPISVTYQKGAKMGRYINMGGGFGDQAKRNNAYVIYPNGVAASTHSYFLFRVYPKVTPGSEVVVPQRPIREPMNAAGWIAIASSMASIALTIATVANLKE